MITVHVDRIIGLEEVRRQLVAHAKSGAIYYSDKSCWWTHHRGHAMRGTAGVMQCPLGGAIFMEKDWDSWLAAAEDNPAHYGAHGLDAFMAAHHANCRRGADGAPFASANWGDYNAALDALIAEEHG
jgi:hypothetical protein